jgi:hypothetical protein
MSQLRLSSHNLEVENGRFVGFDRNDRIYKMCSTHVENEYHFLLCCPIYRELRKRYCINYSVPTLNKFYFLLSSKNIRKIRNVAKFTSCALKLRAKLLANMDAPKNICLNYFQVIEILLK